MVNLLFLFDPMIGSGGGGGDEERKKLLVFLFN